MMNLDLQISFDDFLDLLYDKQVGFYGRLVFREAETRKCIDEHLGILPRKIKGQVDESVSVCLNI